MCIIVLCPLPQCSPPSLPPPAIPRYGYVCGGGRKRILSLGSEESFKGDTEGR